MKKKITVNLFTDKASYPNGTAASNRIRLIGKAFIHGNMGFKVFTGSLKQTVFENKLSGNDDSILYQTTYSRPLIRGKLDLIIAILQTWYQSFCVIRKLDSQNDVVYIYSQGNPFNLYLTYLCKWNKIKIIQEVNEWYHRELNRKLETYINEGPLIKKSDGILPISSTIVNQITKIKPDVSTCIVPVLVDTEMFTHVIQKKSSKYCFWMGLVDGYIHDVLFILKTLSKYNKENELLHFVISGPCKEETRKKIYKVAEELNYPLDHLTLLGYVTDEQLSEYIYNAHCFIVPLWDDVRSASRFPTKIASFMLAGKPVFTCKIGEVGNVLTHMENVVYFEPSQSSDLVDKMNQVFSNQELHNKLNNNSKLFAQGYFDYKSYSIKLTNFVKTILEK